MSLWDKFYDEKDFSESDVKALYGEEKQCSSCGYYQLEEEIGVCNNLRSPHFNRCRDDLDSCYKWSK